MHFIQIGDWIFDVQAQQISRGKQTIQLEPISSTLLFYLCKNSDRIVNRDDLISHVWNNRVVAYSAINRVISMLRKHLGDDPSNPSYIRTVHKQGYLLLVEVRELSEAEQVRYQKQKTTKFSQYFSFVSSGILLLLIAIMVFWNWQPKVHIPTQVATPLIKYQPVISTKGQHSHIVLSHNEKWLLYSETPKTSLFSNLFIKNLQTGKITRLTNGEFDDIGSSFSFDDSELYFARVVRGQSCKIMRIDLVGFTVRQEKEVAQCTNRINYNNVSILPNAEEIVFVDFQLPLGFAVYRYHLQNKSYQPLIQNQSLTSREHYPSLSPNGQWIAMLSNENLMTRIIIKQLQGEQEEYILWQSKDSIDSIAWSHDNQAIYFHDRGLNQMLSINIESGDYKVIDVDSSLFSSLSHQNKQGEVFAVNGRKTQKDVIAISLQPSTEETVLVNSSANDHLALQLNKDELFFVSDKTGLNQFYIRNITGEETQLSHFTQSMPFRRLDLHPNSSEVVGRVNGRLFVFDIQKRQLNWLFDAEIKGETPFYNNKGEIFYLKKEKYQTNLYRYVDKSTEELILQDVGKGQWITNKDGREDLLYQKMNGVIYRYITSTKTTEQETWGLPHPGYFNKMWLGTQQGIYFMRNGNQEDRGAYFKAFNKNGNKLYYLTEPYEAFNITLDSFNQRLLLTKKEKGLLTNVVKIDLNSINGN